MIKLIKIRLLPTEEQRILMFKTAGCSRFAYNWGLNRWNELYKKDLKTNNLELKKEFNNTIKQHKNYKWIKEVSSQSLAQVFLDLVVAFRNFFNNKAEYPNFKCKRKSRTSFYVRNDAMAIIDNTINI